MLNHIVSRFLVVCLSIKAVLQETTKYRRGKQLRAIGNIVDLEGAYGTTLARIKAQGGVKAGLGMAVLMWISHSRRPLRASEIGHAVSIRIGSNALNTEDIPRISALLDSCQGLATIEKGTSTIKLIHFTLQDYLCAHPNLFDRAHSLIAETCLTYLNFQNVKDLSVCSFPDPRGTPFLEYSSIYWGIHMRREPSDRANTFAFQLLDQFDGHISAKLLWRSLNWGFPFGRYRDEPFSALHCTSYFGIAEVTDTLIKLDRWDVNQSDGAGVTPLIWAARYGHEDVVRLLLRKKDIQPDRRDTNSGRTALSWAAENGHEGVVRLFLGPRFANPGSIGPRLGRAWRVVALLFGRRYINPNRSSKYDETPLSFAAQNGHEGIVKLLLERGDVKPDTPDTIYGQTPILRAALGGHEGIVKLLLGRKDVNPDTPDPIHGWTPLSQAASCGYEGVVKLLLDRKDVNPNNPTKSGQTPLTLATENGHDNIVELLQALHSRAIG